MIPTKIETMEEEEEASHRDKPPAEATGTAKPAEEVAAADGDRAAPTASSVGSTTASGRPGPSPAVRPKGATAAKSSTPKKPAAPVSDGSPGAMRSSASTDSMPHGGPSPVIRRSGSFSKSKDLESLLGGDNFVEPRTPTVMRARVEPSSNHPERPGATDEAASPAAAAASPAAASFGAPVLATLAVDDVGDLTHLEVILEDDLPISAYAIDREFPKGKEWSALKRIRSTLLGYLSKTTCIKWYQSFKPPTLISLLGRLQKYEETVTGHVEIDIQIGYRQLVARLAALLVLHRTLKNYNDARVPSTLIKCLKPLSILQKFHDATEATLAPDLLTLRMHAQFQMSLNDGLSKAIDALDLSKLDEWHKLVMKEASDPNAIDDDNDEGADERTGRRTAADKRAKRARTYDYRVLVVEEELISPPASQVMRLVANSMKHYMFKLPGDIVSTPLELEIMLSSLSCALRSWRRVTGDMCDFKDFTEVLSAVRTMCMCGRAAEKDRPPASEVRCARRTLLATLKEVGPIGDVAKAMASGSYDGPRALMESARAHAAAGMEDEASTKRFDCAFDRFESRMGDAFSNIQEWIKHGNDGDPVDINFMGEVLDSTNIFVSDIHCSVDRWSNGALLEQKENLESALQNIITIMTVHNYTMLMVMNEFIINVGIAKLRICMQGLSENAMEAPSPSLNAEENEELEHVPETPAESAMPSTGGLGEHRIASQVLLTSLSSDFVTRRTELSDFGKNLFDAIDRFQKVIDKASLRLGNLSSDLMNELCPARVKESIMDTMQTLTEVLVYFEHCAFLLSGKVYDAESDIVGLTTGSAYIKSMAEFSRLHFKLKAAGHVTFGANLVLDADFLGETLATEIHNFTNTEGEQVFLMHIGCCLKQWIKSVLSFAARTSSVHNSVIEAAQPSKVLPLLILDPALSNLMANEGLDLANASTENIDDHFRSFVYNRALNLFNFVVKNGDIPTVPMEGMQRVDDSGTTDTPDGMDVPDAEVFLDVTCRTRNICALAATIHGCFLLPSSRGENINQDELFGGFSNMFKALADAVASFEDIINGEHAKQLEGSGWRLPASMSHLRDWRKSISLFVGKTERELLKAFVTVLDAAVQKCTQTIPAWEACFKEGMVDEQILSKMLSGRQQMLVKLHNDLHDTMTLMASTAAHMQVTPALQCHELTNESIAVGINVLAKAATANVLCSGMTALEKFRTEPSGPSRARGFVDKHRAKNTSIPPAFWQLFEDVAAYAVSTTVKREQSAQPEVADEPANNTWMMTGTKPSPVAEGAAASSTDGKSRVGIATEVKPDTGVPSLKRRRR